MSDTCPINWLRPIAITVGSLSSEIYLAKKSVRKVSTLIKGTVKGTVKGTRLGN